ncbi:uncharacterized protein LOC121921997 isoform X2 [Sceloporus undulatus]|nr:uncharacterized protein LOC121921997 isoform X2 [Sceloporus undulatus]
MEEDMPESLSGMDGKTLINSYDKGPKNIPWCRNEILDLLDIWGAARFQSRLKESHRNLDIFNDIADEMKKRNHARTGEECKSKTKHMRFEYRKVFNYNKMSGRDPISCPYFKELDDILHGDASIVVNRLSRSINLARGNQAVASNCYGQGGRRRKGFGKSAPSNVPMVPPACNASMESSARAILDESEIGNCSISNTRQENSPQDPAVDENDSSFNSLEQEIENSDGREDNPQDDRFTVVNMSPNTCLQRIRNRSRRAVRG